MEGTPSHPQETGGELFSPVTGARGAHAGLLGQLRPGWRGGFALHMAQGVAAAVGHGGKKGAAQLKKCPL